jgi:hypothetical protein
MCHFASVESRPPSAEPCHGDAYPILALSFDFLLLLLAATIARVRSAPSENISICADTAPPSLQPPFLTEEPTLNMLSVLLARQPVERKCKYDRNH